MKRFEKKSEGGIVLSTAKLATSAGQKPGFGFVLVVTGNTGEEDGND